VEKLPPKQNLLLVLKYQKPFYGDHSLGDIFPIQGCAICVGFSNFGAEAKAQIYTLPLLHPLRSHLD